MWIHQLSNRPGNLFLHFQKSYLILIQVFFAFHWVFVENFFWENTPFPATGMLSELGFQGNGNVSKQFETTGCQIL